MNNQVVLITGGSRGIGFEIVKYFKSMGIEVLNPTRIELDLNDFKSIENYMDKISRVDVLINNAGINILGDTSSLSEEDLLETFQINILSPIKLSQLVIPKMKNGGKIINISSIWSFVSKPKRFSYSSAKAALDGLTRSLAVELGDKNILVNSIAPGFIDTDLTRKNNNELEIKQIIEKIPLKKLGNVQDIAKMAYFLSFENEYITGQTIIIDGGYLCQ